MGWWKLGSLSIKKEERRLQKKKRKKGGEPPYQSRVSKRRRGKTPMVTVFFVAKEGEILRLP